MEHACISVPPLVVMCEDAVLFYYITNSCCVVLMRVVHCPWDTTNNQSDVDICFILFGIVCLGKS